MADIIKKTLTFDDVLLVPQKSSVLPKEVDCSTHLTKNIELMYAPSFSEPIFRAG